MESPDNPGNDEPRAGAPGDDPARQVNTDPPPVFSELYVPATIIDEYRANERKKARRDRWILTISVLTLLAVGIYTVLTGLGLKHAIQSSTDTSKDTQRALKISDDHASAAKRTADAATKAVQQAAADSAENTKRVDRQLIIAEKQASATERSVAQSKTALDRTIEISRLDQRAWVGVVGVNTKGGVVTRDTFAVEGTSLVIHNSGKTPALKIRIDCCMHVTRLWHEAIPDHDIETAAQEEQRAAMRKKRRELLEERIRRYPGMRETLEAFEKDFNMPQRISQGGVLAPSATNTIGIIPSVNWGTRNAQGLPMSLYILGEIVYWDIFPGTSEHTTKFCLMQSVGPAFTICPENNWMN